ncbi:MAG: hypothetical protein KatS3mg088_369 [Patescibacteria group bacterium]|nr:MAG: hypothetical protein KatS3mg088_369 [Patescibacteria group bacterium]
MVVLAQETQEGTPVVENQPQQTETSTPQPTESVAETSTPNPSVSPSLEPSPAPSLEPSPINNLQTETPTPTATPAQEVLGADTNTTTPFPSTPASEDKNKDAHINAVVLSDVSASSIDEADLSYLESATSATLRTDKFDYSPTDAVVITGEGFAPNTEYELVITSGTGNFRFSDRVTSDESGGLFYTYQLDGTYRPEYKAEVFDLLGGVAASVNFSDSDKVRLCHRTKSDSNPYVYLEVNIKNNGDLKGGHLNHTGPIWYPGIQGKWGDIIPPYSSGNFNYSGMNWDANGQAIWNNGCKLQIACQEGPSWTSDVISFNQGKNKDGSDVPEERSDPYNALGKPDSFGNDVNFVSLGKGGSIVLVFLGWVKDKEGNDLSFHEVTWGRENYPEEKAKVEVSQDGDSWYGDWIVSSKATNGIGYIDFSSTRLSWVKYVRITDTTDFSLHTNDADGYDLDALDAVYQLCSLPSPSPTLSPSPTPAPYCGDGVKNGQEQCDGSDGVGQNQFCTKNCKLIPIYDGFHSCPAGTVKSQSPVLSKTISATDSDGETFNLTAGGKYLFEVSGVYSYDKSNSAKWADAAYATDNNWSSARSDIGIWETNRGVTSLLADFGKGVGVVEWDDNQVYNSDHTYQKYYSPTTNSVKFLISDWYDEWYSSPYNNQSAMSDNSGSLSLDVYECQPVSEVTVCKYDNEEHPLSDWRVYLLGDKVGNTISVPSNGTVVNAGSYPNDNYVLLASGTYNYGNDRMNADAANSYRYVGLPCSGPTDGWVSGESSCMGNYLSLNFSTSGGPTAPGWGDYYNPDHIYAKFFAGGGLNLKVWDRCSSNQVEGCYGDNEGSLSLDIYKGFVGDTGENGCVTFTNVPYGAYQLGEILQEGWQKVSGSGEVVIDSDEENFDLINNELPKKGNLKVSKVVDWKNVTPDTSKTFEICITGPSYPNPDCKTADYDGETLEWKDILAGDYTVTETTPTGGWIVTGSGQTVTVNKDQTSSVEIKNEANSIIIKAYKVVCDSEQYLPNWGNHGSVIGANTAQSFVNNSQGHCRLEDGWKFQYAPKGSGSNGAFQTNTQELGTPWTTFGPTVGGEAVAVINDISNFDGRIETREVFKDNTYIPFSNSSNNVSAEFYCTGDTYNYDNWEWINNPQYGSTYYCVAFNAKKSTVISGRKFNDLNYNGKDDEEPGLENWKILAAQKVDEVNVSAKDMPTVSSNIPLISGQEYLLRVSGTYQAGDNITADAKYSVRSPNTYWTDYVQNYQSYGPTLLDLQINNNSYDWGSYNPNHVYWLILSGGGSPINFRLNDIYPSNNSGSLNVKIYKVISETTTANDGSYQLTLTSDPGSDIIVAEETQSGYMQITPNGENFGYCNVTSYQENKCNFGNALAYGSIYGYKYDEDRETGLGGWTIFIDDNNNGILDQGEKDATTSDDEKNNGYYEFNGLTAGTYSVCEVEQEGWQRMYPLGSNCQSVTITSGSKFEVDFQNRKVVLGLSLTKSNDAATALSAGSQVNYTLKIKNTGNQKLTGVIIKDAPAGGFTYVDDSGILDSNPINPTQLGGYLDWYIGDLDAGEEKVLSYKMSTNSGMISGIYPNVAIATGIYTPSEYQPEEVVTNRSLVVEALAVDGDSGEERVESNAGVPVNSQVEIKAPLAYSTGVGGTGGQVLGASTEAGEVLPAAGSDSRIVLFALLGLILGALLKVSGLALERNWVDYRKLKKNIKRMGSFIAVLIFLLGFAPSARAFSDYVYITQLPAYLNKEDFKISYSALSENPISAQFYIRKDGDSSWRTLGSSLSGASGYVQVHGGDIYNGDGKYFFKVVINSGSAEDQTSTIIDRQSPDPVRDYWKEKLGDGHYKLHWRNPDNEDFDKVIIYRSDSTNFTADSSTEIATVWGSRNSEMTYENAAVAGKEYYFAIRAIDKAGNASSVVADPETQVSAGAVLGESTVATGSPKAEVVKILPKEEKKGEVLGEENREEEPVSSPTPEVQEQSGGVLGQAIKFAKDRTKITLLIALGLGIVSYYLSRLWKKNKN